MTCASCPNELPPKANRGPARLYCSQACRQRASYYRAGGDIEDWPPSPDGDMSWRDAGACLDHDPMLWFPDRGGSAAQAKAICADCPVMAECLDHAITFNEGSGIWGGTNEKERRTIKRRRRQEAAA